MYCWAQKQVKKYLRVFTNQNPLLLYKVVKKASILATIWCSFVYWIYVLEIKSCCCCWLKIPSFQINEYPQTTILPLVKIIVIDVYHSCPLIKSTFPPTHHTCMLGLLSKNLPPLPLPSSWDNCWILYSMYNVCIITYFTFPATVGVWNNSHDKAYKLTWNYYMVDIVHKLWLVSLLVHNLWYGLHTDQSFFMFIAI